MKRLTALALVLAGCFMAMAQPANARPYVVNNVDFFERVTVGFVEVTPIAVFQDRRCFDPQACSRNGTMVISVLLHDIYGFYEVILELDQPVQVPGGLLMLSDPGTAPVRNGAIPLSRYNLQFVYFPLPDDDGS